MRLIDLASARKLLSLVAAAAFLSLASIPSHAQDDPPSQAGRLSFAAGNVSIQPEDSDDWSQALPNLSLGPGDRIFTDYDGRAEIQVGQTFIRIGPNSDVSFVDSTPWGISFGVAAGSVHLRTLGLWQDQSVYINTPNGSATLAAPGEMRVDVMPDQGAAIFTSFSGNQQITGAGDYAQYIGSGQALELAGSNPVYPQWLQPADWDSLDNWSQQRDRQLERSASYRYVSPEIPGASELDANGTWMPGSDYGPIWFPNNVPYGWSPYRYGHWVNHRPWGWVWVEDESWGYAPFHYGRWVSFDGRWGWVPGPPAEHPVWSPALVVFAGGIRFGGAGVSAWFPLGPGEAYRPWYRCSPDYINRVNRTNIVEAPRVHVQTTYVNIVNVTNVTNVVYVNRTIGVTAVSHADFAAGRPVHQAAVAVDTRQLDHVQVIDRPEPQPTKQPVAAHPPSRPVPVSTARPVVMNQTGKLIATKPDAPPMEPPVKQIAPPRPLPGRTVVAAPINQPRFQPNPKPLQAPAPPVINPVQPAKPAPPPVRTTPMPMDRPVMPNEKPTQPPAPVPPQPAPKPVPPAPRPTPPPPPPPAARPVPPPPAPAPPPPPKPAPPAPRPAPEPIMRPAPPPERPAPPPPEPKPAPPAARPAPPPPPRPAPEPQVNRPQNNTPPAKPAKDEKDKKDVPK